MWTGEQRNSIGEATRDKIARLNELAKSRGQTLPQMAIAWILRRPEVTSALIGASSPEQIRENAGSLGNLGFSEAELSQIDQVTTK
jgi:L-glyceraldehyde 3-phosphate reductase